MDAAQRRPRSRIGPFVFLSDSDASIRSSNAILTHRCRSRVPPCNHHHHRYCSHPPEPQYFASLLDEKVNEEELSAEEQKERR